jgi:glycosyltransferase involved in cell wall biosynthesis
LTLVTIAVPTFNRAPQIAALLECLEREIDAVPAGDVAVLVSDNCSEDDTAAVLADWAATRPWLQIRRQPENLGAVGNVRWLGANVTNSDYVWMFGDDDLLVPGSLPAVLDALREARPAWLFLPHNWVKLDGEIIPGSPVPDAIEHFDSAGDLWRAYHHWLTFLSASVVRADKLREAVEAVDTDNAYGPLVWYFHAGLDAPCAVVPGPVVLGSLDISWTDRQHVILTEHFTGLYDEIIHLAMSRAEFASTLDGLYADPGLFQHWRKVPLDTFAAIVARFPESRALHHYLFAAAREQGDTGALSTLDEAARALGHDEEARAAVAAGEVLYEAGDIVAAAQRFTEATALMPSLAAAWNDLAVVLNEMGRIADAIAAVEAALFIAPDDEDARANRDDLWRRAHLVGMSPTGHLYDESAAARSQ